MLVVQLDYFYGWGADRFDRFDRFISEPPGILMEVLRLRSLTTLRPKRVLAIRLSFWLRLLSSSESEFGSSKIILTRNSSENCLSLYSLSFVMEFSDEEWEIIRPLLPPKASVGRPRIDDRLIVNGILYVLDAVGWISPLGMAYTRPAEIGLRGGVLEAYGLRFLKP